MTKIIMAMVASIMVTSASAEACSWDSGCAQGVTRRVFEEYGPKVPESVRRTGRAVRDGAGRVTEEIIFLSPKLRVGKNRLKPPSIPGMLLKPRCAGEDC
jgi:hypothetical protein